MTRADFDWCLLFACWLLAAASALGSLFFSQVMGLPPCELCWYQRLFMFPLVLVLGAGLFPFDAKAVKFALPLALAGLAAALYHNLLYAGIIPESARPCAQGVSCAEKQLELFGFVTIPLLSLASFAGIAALLAALKRRTRT